MRIVNIFILYKSSLPLLRRFLQVSLCSIPINEKMNTFKFDMKPCKPVHLSFNARKQAFGKFVPSILWFLFPCRNLPTVSLTNYA